MLEAFETRIAGVDEVGRGPLAGPVVAAAVILDPDRPIAGIKDSKKLSEKQRECLAQRIHENALAVSIGRAEVDEIDALNILQASLLAMQRAVSQLTIKPTEVWVDGNCCPRLDYPCRAIVRGDQLEVCIGAASIVAKVHRDQEMARWEAIFPGYGFSQNKGYPTANHLSALEALGPSPLHRRSFGPVKKYSALLDNCSIS